MTALGLGLSLPFLAARSGGGGAPSSDWRVDVSAAYDSGADSALVASLIGWKTTKARPTYTVAVGQTRTVAVRLVAAASAFLAYYVSGTPTTFSTAFSYSTDSTNGQDGTWTSIAHTPLAPNSAYANRRQIVAIPQDGDVWVRASIGNTHSGAFTAGFLVCNDLGASNDMWITIGASIEQFLGSTRVEHALLDAYPGRDPIVLNWGLQGGTASSILSSIPAAEEAYAGLANFVYYGNIIGNDITDNRPISDDTPETLDAIRASADAIYQTFAGKQKFAAGTTFRSYTGVTPEAAANGSLPYNQQVLYPSIEANVPSAFDGSAGLPRVDLYAWGIYNRFDLTDEIHYLNAGYVSMAAEIARTCGARVYTRSWPVTFTEYLVQRFEAERLWHLQVHANYAVSSMENGAAKAALQARINAVVDILPTRVKLSHGATVPPSGWNQRSGGSGGAATPLVTEDGWKTPYTFAISVAGTSGQALGAQGAAPGFEFPDPVLLDFYYAAPAAVTMAVKWAGLPAQKCTVKTIGSRAGSGTRNQNNTIGVNTQVMNSLGNVSTFLTFSDVEPTSGEIEMSATFASGNTTGIYFNAHILEITAEAV